MAQKDRALCPTLVMTILGHPALQIRGRRHADHVEAGVDEMHFAGNAARRSLSR